MTLHLQLLLARIFTGDQLVEVHTIPDVFCASSLCTRNRSCDVLRCMKGVITLEVPHADVF